MAEPIKVTTGTVRFSYLNVFKPRADKGSDKEKYSAMIIIPKSDTKTVKLIKEAIEKAKIEGANILGKGACKNPLKDGDKENDNGELKAHCEGSYYMNVSSNFKPDVINKQGRAVNQEDFWSGCYGRVVLTFSAYNLDKAKGITARLGNILFEKQGESLGGSGGSNAVDDFKDFISSDFSEDEDDGLPF